MRTEVGAIELADPRDRDGSLEPQIVPEHSRRLAGFDKAVTSLYAKDLTTGEIQAHLERIYEVEVSRSSARRGPESGVASHFAQRREGSWLGRICSG